MHTHRLNFHFQPKMIAFLRSFEFQSFLCGYICTVFKIFQKLGRLCIWQRRMVRYLVLGNGNDNERNRIKTRGKRGSGKHHKTTKYRIGQFHMKSAIMCQKTFQRGNGWMSNISHSFRFLMIFVDTYPIISGFFSRRFPMHRFFLVGTVYRRTLHSYRSRFMCCFNS